MRSIDLLLHKFFASRLGEAQGAWKALCTLEHWKLEKWISGKGWKVEK